MKVSGDINCLDLDILLLGTIFLNNNNNLINKEEMMVYNTVTMYRKYLK